MARPKKNYCDYFPHDRDMRNHRKVKAIRTKFGPIGYAIWSMTLEYLTGIDGNVFDIIIPKNPDIYFKYIKFSKKISFNKFYSYYLYLIYTIFNIN